MNKFGTDASPRLLVELNVLRDHFAFIGDAEALRIFAACPVLSRILPPKPMPRPFDEQLQKLTKNAEQDGPA